MLNLVPYCASLLIAHSNYNLHSTIMVLIGPANPEGGI